MRFPSSLLNQYSQDRAPGRSETLTTVTAGDATAYKHDFAPRSQKYLPDQACWAKTIATKWQQELDKAKTDKDNATEPYMFSEVARVEAECQWKKKGSQNLHASSSAGILPEVLTARAQF